MLNKKTLIISNNALSDVNSNGRTLKNFFNREDKDKLAQFFIQPDIPDHSSCQSFFCATDGQVLKSLLKGKSAGSIVKEQFESNTTSITTKKNKTKRTPFTMLVRNFIWSRTAWRTNFLKWVDDFNPELILLQAGDCPFLYDISVELAKKYRVPLLIYNSEDYYFKNYNYFRNSGVWGIFYPIFRYILKCSAKKAIDYSSLSIYISEDLKNLYDQKFNKKSDYIYTSTEVFPCIKNEDEPIFSYLGNLGLNRHLGLIEIAEALQKIDPAYKLNIYGKIPNENVLSAFKSCDAVRYMGLVSYDEVKEAIQKSMLVFHTESFDKFYSKDIARGFSTKIADSLASGTCFVLYAPEHISCAKYLKQNDCAVVITSEAELKSKLAEIIQNKELRDYYINRSIEIAQTNHNAEKNREKFSFLINAL